LRKSRKEAIAEALELCETLPIKTVARNLADDYPEYFGDTDAARSALRYKLGSNGDAKRRLAGITDPKISTIAEGIAKLRRHDFNREEILRFTDCKALVLSDIHIPYHDSDALALAVEYGKDCDVIILNGDILDFYQISRFGKELDRMSVQQEVDVCREFLEDLRDWFPEAKIVFKQGNHEVRLGRYLTSQARELADIYALGLESLLGLEDLDIAFVKSAKIMLGKLAVLHGHELPMGILGPVNPARGVFLKAKASAIVGHWHFTSEHGEPDLHREETACWSTGCLCDLQPDYMPHNRWNHGFAIVDVDDDGGFTVHNHRIIGGKVR
jgi:predicted phosphodiesterase